MPDSSRASKEPTSALRNWNCVDLPDETRRIAETLGIHAETGATLSIIEFERDRGLTIRDLLAHDPLDLKKFDTRRFYRQSYQIDQGPVIVGYLDDPPRLFVSEVGIFHLTRIESEAI